LTPPSSSHWNFDKLDGRDASGRGNDGVASAGLEFIGPTAVPLPGCVYMGGALLGVVFIKRRVRGFDASRPAEVFHIRK